MQLAITGRHMDVTDALKEHIEGRLGKLKGHFERIIDARVILAVEKHRHIAEITLHANGIRIHGRESSDDMYGSVDAVVEKLDKQVRKFRTRINRFQPRKEKDLIEFEHQVISYEPAMSETEGAQDEGAHKVIKRDKLTVIPMTIEEALMRLELVEDHVLVFSHSETQQITVLYKRGDSTIGLIEAQ